MDEHDIPIDINTTKLLDWLISRRHVNKDWQNNILKVREKINSAIQDMPAHEGIIKLLSGQHINYFHCLKIVDILKETEADTKNLFGRYGSQRMKDWQDIISTYQKDNLYLAEAAQMLIRNVSYEIPGLKKHIGKIEQSQLECEKKIKDYGKVETSAIKEFNVACEQLGIPGEKIKVELLGLLKELPKIYQEISDKIKNVQPAIELYTEFGKFLSGKDSNIEMLSTLKYLVEKGNTTTYEYTYGEKPVKIEEEELIIKDDTQEKDNRDSIDFGDEIDFGDQTNEIDFGDIDTSTIDFGNNEANIDWGTLNNEEGFEIVNHVDADINLEESGIVVENTGVDGGIARGVEALTILDNPKTHEQIINNLMEISAFLKVRFHEMYYINDVSDTIHTFSTLEMQNAPALIQTQTIEGITALIDCVNVALMLLTNKRIQHLHNIKHSSKYVDILAASLKRKLSIVDRMKANKKLVEKKIVDLQEEKSNLQPIIKVLIKKTKELQKDVQEDISKKYKGRVVNIIGGVNLL